VELIKIKTLEESFSDKEEIRNREKIKKKFGHLLGSFYNLIELSNDYPNFLKYEFIPKLIIS
jgi:hypothetical protein